MAGTNQTAPSALDELQREGARERAGREAAEAQLRRLLDVSLLGVCTCDLAGRVLEANDAFLRMLGSSREQVRARALDLLELTPPAFRERAREARRRVVEEGELPPAEIELWRADGKSAPVLIAGTRLPGRDSVVLFAQDLSEARRKDAAVRSAEARLALLLAAAPLRLFEVDPGGALTLSEGSLAPERPSILGQSLFSLWSERPDVLALLERALAGERVRARIAAGGRIFDTTLEPQRAQPGAPVAFVRGVSVEVTQEARAKEERRLLQERLAQEHQLDGLGMLATGLAYTFNNLLAGMLANASAALLELDPSSPSRGALEDVLTSASHAAALTRQVLQTASPSPAESGPLDLSACLREMAPLLSAAVPRPGRLELRLEGVLPLVRSHPVQLRRALVPLLSGAIEATRARGGLIRLVAKLVELDAANGPLLGGDRLEPGWYASVSLCDDGAPIDAAALQTSFDPLHTALPSGRALGLAAVLGSMRAQHGGVRLRSGEAEGTQIELLYPASDAPAQALPLGPPRGPARSREVLIVDDDPIILRAAHRILHSIGLRVLEASSGDEAVERLRDPAANPGLALLDFAMPGLSGEQTLRALKQLRPELRVLLCSGYSREEASSRIDPAQLSGFLAKPFTAVELQDAVLRALEGDAGREIRGQS